VSVVGVWRDVVGRLTPVPATVRQHYLALPPTREAHTGAHKQVAALHQIELVQDAPAASHGTNLRVAAWNLERCLYPDESARILARHGVDVALLTEMDVGVLRTGLVHTIERVASQLGQRYCYALEFLELVSSPPPPGFPRNGDANTEAFHGNGIVTSLHIGQPIVIRLDEQADWFAASRDNQRRIGNRMAVAATFNAGEKNFVACSVHLENRTDGCGRAAQMATLMDAVDTYAGDLPVIIGGDLNTHVGPGGHTDASEPLFSMAVTRGYDWTACNLARPTTRQSTWSQSEGTRQLDWFCTRGLHICDPDVIPAIGENGEILSDHEMLVLTLRLD
jgi:endonuclease/exonuclease/phosphatase family metal-dependent hydrolase